MKKPQGVAVLAALTSSLLTMPQMVNADVRAAAQNPISSMISLPLKITFDQGASNGSGTIFNINPVAPVTVGDWNLVNRALIPLANVDGSIQGPNNPSPQGGGSASGIGDIN